VYSVLVAVKFISFVASVSGLNVKGYGFQNLVILKAGGGFFYKIRIE
jgi:hypothetical protein